VEGSARFYYITLHNLSQCTVHKGITFSDQLRTQVLFPVLVFIAPTVLSRCLLRIKKKLLCGFHVRP